MNTKKLLDKIIQNELDQLPELIESLSKKDRCMFLIQLMKYNDSQKASEPFNLFEFFDQ